MKMNKVLAGVGIAALTVSCNNQIKTTKKLNNQIDSVSYAMGLDMASKFKKNAKEINKDVFIQGFIEGAQDSTKFLISKKDVPAIINVYFKKRQEELMKKRNEENKAKALKTFGEYKKENEKFLEENKAKKNVKTTASGLQYIVLKEGKGDVVKSSDMLTIHYAGSNIKGEEFDSSYKRKEPIKSKASQFVKGFSEGLLMMKKGAKYRLFIPQELAYGDQQRGQFIKPFSTLIFDVELVDINKK